MDLTESGALFWCKIEFLLEKDIPNHLKNTFR